MTLVDRLRTLLREHPLAVDVLVASALFLVVLFVPDPDRGDRSTQIPPSVAFVAALTCAALLLRRHRPVLALVLTAAGAFAATVLGAGHTLLVGATLLALYTVALVSDRRTAWVAWGMTALGLVVGSALAATNVSLGSDVLSNLANTGIAAAVGVAQRNRRAYVAAIEERAVRAEQSREQEAHRHVAEERLRIARELHDVVAHHIAVVNVQAGVASHLLTSQPEAAETALAHVRQSARTILEELGGILHVLRQPEDDPDPTAPAPGLAQLDTLVASFASAGLVVDWSLIGKPRPVGDTVDLVAYRLLEEALTNAHKHGTGTAHVTVDYSGPSVLLLVSNPVSGAEASARQGVAAHIGHGLLGMRERAAAVGGVLSAALGPDGQFRVEAVLPLPVLAVS